MLRMQVKKAMPVVVNVLEAIEVSYEIEEDV